MRDRELIVHKPQWSILHALMPSFPQSHNTRPMQKQIIPTNQWGLRRCWLNEMEDRRGELSGKCTFPVYCTLLLLRILIGARPYYGAPSRSALVGNSRAARSVASRIQTFMQKLTLGQLEIISTGDMCTDQSCPKQISPLNSNHRLEVVTDFKREWKDNSRTGKDLLMVTVYFHTLSAS